MRTTKGGIIGKPAAVGLGLTLLLQGCVISSAEYARPDADAQQLAADKLGCSQPGPAIAGVLAGGALGAVAGAGTSATGSSDGTAIGVGLLIAGAYGLIAAIMSYGDVAEYDRCMQGKGYHAVSDAAQPASLALKLA
jgi:hypothetical protein